ncbi:centromere/kinetochore protein zw10 homolog [Punica granatum]|uniref:Centromere/kinetochore protein zw10 homolog n=1 Tax=Punica granatum TaxID=22663 RepID=A0A6P8DKT6_PUNGR|nr:centromere/kinetochore protein zw10 homolog [Punica granatum]
MDVLFNTINVRDLLSATDLSDPSSPLSAPDLRLLINRLESHSQSIKAQVRSYLLSHQPEFSSLFSLCSDLVSRTDDVSGEFHNLLRLISDRPIDVEIRQAVSDIDERMKEVKVKKELLGLVRAIWGLTERFRTAKEALRSGQLKFAAQELRELKMAVRLCDGEDKQDEREPLVYGLLKKEWHESFEEMQEVLSKFVDQAVRYDQKLSRVQVKYQLSSDGNDGVDFHEVLEALDVVGLLDYGLARVADMMIKYIITPVINSGSPIAFVEELSKKSEKTVEAILKIERSSAPETGNLDGETIFSEIVQVVKFTCERICFQNAHWVQSFGRLAWTRISEMIISNVLSKVVPEDASKLANFQKIIDRTTEFETALKDLSFISASDSAEQRLSNFAENVEVHFAAKRKTEILAKARKVLLHCDFAIPQEYIRKGGVGRSDGIAKDSSDHVVDLLFLSDRCFVSTAASELMKLVHQTLQDVCLSSPRVALELYHAARDAILLYEAIVPVKQEKQLDGINQVAVLMHNDFLYLSQEILGLAFQYWPEFPDSIKERAVFVDLAPRFLLKAEEVLQREIQVVIYNLKGAIDGADGFQNTHQMQQFESAKFSIDQVVFILEKVRIIWEPILLPSTYYKSMGTVLDSVLSRIVRDILFLDDMAAEETLQLQRLILLMLEGLSSLLGSLGAVTQEMKSQGTTLCSLDDLIPSLRKIRKLAELLDMPLRSITAAWESGELVSCGFTLTEVKDFIKAIFTDSPLRKECLWRIENISF